MLFAMGFIAAGEGAYGLYWVVPDMRNALVVAAGRLAYPE